MTLKYRIQKKWFAFWQKYKLAAQYKNIRKLIAFLIIVWLLGSLVTIASQWLFHRGLHHSLSDYMRYFWYVIIELVSGFDIPADEIPLHWVSQVVSILMLIMGIIVVGLFTGQIISMFVHVLQRADYFSEKPPNFRFKNPIIICGVNGKLLKILSALKKSRLIEDREIIIIDENADAIHKIEGRNFEDIWYIKGNPCDRDVITQAIGREDSRLIILSKEENGRHRRDASAISTALAIEAFDENIHTVVEVPRPDEVVHYQATKINECIHVSEFSLKLISQSTLRPGIANVFNLLLGEDLWETNSNQIFFSPLPAVFIGASYRQIVKVCVESIRHSDFTLIGFAKFVDEKLVEKYNLETNNMPYFIQINPVSVAGRATLDDCFIKENNRIFMHKETKLLQKDKLVYISENPINFERELSDLELKIGENSYE